MKKIFLGMIFVFVLLVSVFSVSAITLGDTGTKASNINENRDVYKDTTITNSAITASTVCTTQLFGTKYVNNPATAVANNINVTYTVSSGTVAVKARIPENLDAVNKDTLDLSAFKVADIICKDGDITVFSDDLYMWRKNMFGLKKIYAVYGTDESTFSEDGDKITDLEPGQVVDLEVEGENLFTDNDGIELEMNVRVVFEDDNIDFDEEDDLDIGADEKDSVSFDIELDQDDVEDKTYTGTVFVVGTDEYGAYHGEVWTIKFDVNREKYMVEVISMTVNPISITCESRDISLLVKIKNSGKKNDDEIKLEVVSTALGLSQAIDNIDLDSTDETRKSFSFSVPYSVDPGNYDITAKTYSLGLSLSNQYSVQLSVPDCRPEQPPVVVPPTPPTNNNVDVVITPPADGDDDDINVIPPTDSVSDIDGGAEESEEGTSNNMLYLVLLIVLIVVLLGGIGGLLVYLMKPAN